LVYIDADTQLSAGGLSRLFSLMLKGSPAPETGADLVTAVPRQQMEGWGERLMMPLLHLTYTSWLPLDLVFRSDDPRFLAANGQVMAMRRSALEEVGGFESVRREVVDDMALARRMKSSGRKVVFADGYDIANCRMYKSTRELVDGFSKNLYEGIGSSVFALMGVIALYAGTFLVPYLGLGASAFPSVRALFPDALWAASACGVLLNVCIRALLVKRFSHPMEGIALHPIAIIGFIAIAVNSCLWHLKDTVKWSGRTYSARSNR
jgi:chlorobactene glucosyltransferase